MARLASNNLRDHGLRRLQAAGALYGETVTSGRFHLFRLTERCMIWPFNRRRRYNGDVAALLPAFGVDLNEAGPMKVLDVLDIAWAKGFTSYEAALMVAYSVAGGLAGGGYLYRAQSILHEKIRPVQDDWLKKGIVRREVVGGWYAKGEESLRKQREQASWPQKATTGKHFPPPKPEKPKPEKPITTPGMTPGIHVFPDVMVKDPVRAFELAGHFCLLLRDVGPYVDFEHMTEVPNVRFPLVLAMASPGRDDVYVIAVEQTHGETPEMMEFPRVEEKRSLGRLGEPVDEDWFVLQALRLAAARFNLDCSWKEMPVPVRRSSEEALKR